uniref:Retrovirus-related Pol polyprotein from transposon TNT 1-94 n=1 Tax=Tanacetum cinerariifolium TaxID=118510 RepID=A0A6L2M0N3_TANCI|nr:retrovirus-related Pol polyprotein from transposon TNT 1-94 [Tanacetum cinerariifolium]
MVKPKLVLLEAAPLNTQSPKLFQPKIKGLVAETFDWDEEDTSKDEEMTQVEVLMELANDELAVGKNHARNGEWIDITIRKLVESSSKNDVKENTCIPASLDYDHEMVPKFKDWVEMYNPDNKLPKFNTVRILVLEIQAVNECLKLTEVSTDHESFKESGLKPQTPLPPLKNLQRASLNSERRILAESSQSSESSIGVSCTTCESNVHSTTDHNNSEHFKRGEKIQAKRSRESTKRKKSQAIEMIMSFIKMVENQNDAKVKQIKTDNETEFRNYELESFCDEKGIFQNFSYPYTPEQNGVAERKNRTLIEAARTMLNGLILSKHFWTEVVRIACYTQNRSIIVKRHDKIPYEIFRKRIPDINYFHMFRCLVFIHNHKDQLGKFNAKADDGYFLGYSFVFKAFKVFNTRQQIEKTYHVTFD